MIPIAQPQLGVEEMLKVVEVINSGMLAAGSYVKEFEREFARYHNIKHAVATSSGTAALHAILQALGISKGDKVLTTPFSFVASANSIIYCGARPVFVDIDAESYSISPQALAQAIKDNPDAKALLLVHIFGQPAEMDEIVQLAKGNKLLLIEDCAQAHGASYEGKKVGTFGDAAAFSFYPTKNITCGEGGMVITDREDVAHRVRMFINHGQRERYHHESLGYNFRMTNIHAAIGIEQLKKLNHFNQKRIENAEYYLKEIKNPEIKLPSPSVKGTHVYHQFTIQVNQRDAFIAYLKNQGIGCAVHYPIIIPKQKLYREKLAYTGSWPVAEQLAKRCVSIPIHPGVSPQQRKYIAEVVDNYG
ncbi:DegT/DnrJ/EryC1/StrS family aminotransferase [Desulfofalx alkaliphila]|uniref:DegT/DnrJ/EryC1/StrS family aminotransferase n=1 Tax=Desulfofalx alkaliphila TaxID=105483 RepID=UPI0004E1564C|nr:DegT/DnrJ/EryC1/StrS family aminotransferase [Desulfofalx alkaliphila]